MKKEKRALACNLWECPRDLGNEKVRERKEMKSWCPRSVPQFVLLRRADRRDTIITQSSMKEVRLQTRRNIWVHSWLGSTCPKARQTRWNTSYFQCFCFWKIWRPFSWYTSTGIRKTLSLFILIIGAILLAIQYSSNYLHSIMQNIRRNGKNDQSCNQRTQKLHLDLYF